MFINLWAEPLGHPWSYPAVYDLVRRLRRRTGIAFDPHWCRHSAVTRMPGDGVPIEVVSTLLGHSSVTTTLSVYTPTQPSRRTRSPGPRRLASSQEDTDPPTRCSRSSKASDYVEQITVETAGRQENPGPLTTSST